ncbi:hypothetical protein Tco_1180685 [Tanacetum coccineum]
MSTLQFAKTHNMIVFLEKPAESNGFQEIIDFLNANQIHYALTVNPTIYTSCIEQFWATAKAKTVNGERQLQALVDKKKVIITETSIRSDLHLEDAGGIDCLPTATIFEELARMGYEKPSQKLTFYKAFFSPQWKFLIHTITQCLSAKTTAWNEFSSTMASAIICLATNQKFNLSKYIFDAMVKHIEGGVKFLMYPRFVQVFINKQLGIPTNSQQTPITTKPSSSKPQKKQSRRKQRRETKVPQDETHHDDSVPIPYNDPLLSGEDRMQLTELMISCTNLQKQVLDLEKAKDAQAKEIAASEDKESLGAQEDASKQGRNFEDFDKDAKVSLVDETQGRLDDAEMFDTYDLHSDEVIVDMAVGEKQEKSAKVDEREVSTGVEDSATILVTTVGKGVTTAIDELTLAQTLIGIKKAKPKSVTTTATTTTTTSPKTKDKGKAIMIEPKVPLKRKDQVALDEEMERNLEAYRKKDKSSSKKIEIAQDNSAKRAGDKLEFDESKKQKTDENEEVEEDNEVELKKHLVIVKDDDIAIDAIPVATKPPVIVEYKLIKEGIVGHYQLIRADGSSKRYSSMIRMLQGIDREYLQTL